jgi:hypothetical protein
MKNEEEIIVIAVYGTAVEAHLAKGLLEESGIPAFFKDENVTQLYPGLTFGGVNLCIMKKDEERAIEVLNNNELIED